MVVRILEICPHTQPSRTTEDMALHGWPHDRRKASDPGFSYRRLMWRFGAPFPGHGHAWLADRTLATRKGERDGVSM